MIPIIGPELLRVETDSGPRLLYEWLAEKLAARLSVDPTQLPQGFTVNDVACAFLEGRGRREETYARVRSILRENSFIPPTPLRKIAAITDFDLYVSLTFDTLLEQAINTERFAGASSTEGICYAPNKVIDIPAERERLSRPVVYQLLGKCSASPTYVVSDDDMLEFVSALQTDHLVPQKLFHELEHSHLLIIGSDLSNWLARLFLRMTKRKRLSDPREVGEILAGNHAEHDGRLVDFLRQVSMRTHIYTGAERFVDELHRRWLARQPATSEAVVPPVRIQSPAREMPDGAVFISYAREDLDHVVRLKADLDATGIPNWFDMSDLQAGEDFDRKIKTYIGTCSYFIPVISETTNRRTEGFFRREWSYAIDRMRNMDEDTTFVLPVCIGCVDISTARVPDKFKALHAASIKPGAGTLDLASRLAELIRKAGQ